MHLWPRSLFAALGALLCGQKDWSQKDRPPFPHLPVPNVPALTEGSEGSRGGSTKNLNMVNGFLSAAVPSLPLLASVQKAKRMHPKYQQAHRSSREVIGADPTIPRRTHLRILRLLDAELGLKVWPKDVLRHTCASMLMAEWEDEARVGRITREFARHPARSLPGVGFESGGEEVLGHQTRNFSTPELRPFSYYLA